MQRDFRGFLGTDHRALCPVGENAIRIGAQVVLPGLPSGEFEVPARVRVRCVRMHPVGGLNRYARVQHRFTVPIEHASLDGAQAAGKLSLSRTAKFRHPQARKKQNSENDQSSFHFAPRSVPRVQFYAPLSRGIETNAGNVLETQLLFARPAKAWHKGQSRLKKRFCPSWRRHDLVWGVHPQYL
jgi:hypothetical protein